MASKTQQRLLIAAVVLALLAGLFFGLLALWRINRDGQPTRPRISVDARFKAIRESPGHVVHIQTAHLECQACHAIADAQARRFDVPKSDLCARCHGALPLTMHASVLAQAGTECLNCHTFSEDYTIRRDNCVRCHSKGQGFLEPIVTHSKEACVGCHRVHQEPSLLPRPCESCHKESTGAQHRGAGAVLCLDCHRSHEREAEADKRCADCHFGVAAGRARIRTAALSRYGHGKCVDCHAPHDFSAQGARPCDACHRQPSLGGSREHQQCQSCHPPHQVRNDDSRVSCVACHLNAATTDHPAVPTAEDGPCLGCHPIHPREPAPQCSTCHGAASETGFHAGEVTCLECHAPHRVKLSSRDTCARCHETQNRAARKNKGHAKCASCHERAAHEPSRTPKACIACHREQAKTAPAGHAPCAKCHETHAGELLMTCAQCHQEQARQGHLRVPERCDACHRAHGPDGVPEPPKCTKCHKPSQLPGLHGVTEHRACAECHQAHEATPLSDRISCLRCHKAQVGHEPTAKKCSGCHVFKK